MQTVPIVILGTDAVLAASPATPVQLTHACLRAGFANVVPASWGDELVASAVLRRLPNFGAGPVIQCSCPIVAHRLLTVGGDLRPVLLPVVPPPVAVARYVRSLAQPTRTRITYVGSCPGAVDDSIDIRMTPDALIAMLAERDIVIEDQPYVFESVLPPDRRRHRSQPGGVPSADALWTELGARTLVEVDGDDFIGEVAQLLLTGKNVLIDTSARLGCACSGAVNGTRHPRSAVVALEPPRSTTSIVDEQAPINLDMPVPAASRTPVDVVALSPTPPSPVRAMTPPNGIEVQLGNRLNPIRASAPLSEPRVPRTSGPIVPRSVLGTFPVTRDVEGKSLPRAYVARRRSSPKGISFTLPPEDPVADAAAPPLQNPAPAALSVQNPAPAAPLLQHTQPALARIVAPVAADAESLALLLPAGTPYTPDVTPSPSPSQAQTSRTPASSKLAPTPTNGAARSNESSDTPPPRRSRSESWSAPPPPPRTWTLSRGQLVGILLAIVMIAISVSTVVAIIVGRSVSASINSPLGR